MSSDEQTAAREIDDIISTLDDWRGVTLARLRSLIMQADPTIVEEVKWKKPSRPEGVPVWTRDGNLCIGEALKSAVRLTFPKGAQLPDPQRLFNTRLDSKSVRAIDFFENMPIDETGLRQLIVAAVKLNT